MGRRRPEMAEPAGHDTPPPDAVVAANDHLLTVLSAGLMVREASARDGAPVWRVSGNTLAHRVRLREAGGNWNRVEAAWEFTDGDPTAAVALALSAPAPVSSAGNGHDGACRATPGAGPDGAPRAAPGPGHNHPPRAEPEKPHYWGHRQRVRDRATSQGVEGFQDYEILELLLFYGIERIDTKPVAKQLLERFGTLGDVLAADPELLKEHEIDPRTLVLLRATREIGRRLARREIVDRPVIGSWQKLIDYCHAAIAHESTERFHILFLDRKNTLIADETQQRGTVDHTPVYPREVVKRALSLNASAIIMVHNHPSGDPTPSRADIEMTNEVKAAAKALGIELHDHLVIGRKNHASFKSLGLL